MEWRAPFLVFSVDLVIRVVLPFLDLSCGNRALPHWSYRLVGGAEPPIWVEGLTNLRNILTALYNSDNRCTTGAQKQKKCSFLKQLVQNGIFFFFLVIFIFCSFPITVNSFYKQSTCLVMNLTSLKYLLYYIYHTLFNWIEIAFFFLFCSFICLFPSKYHEQSCKLQSIYMFGHGLKC